MERHNEFLQIIKRLVYDLEQNYGWGEKTDETRSLFRDLEENGYEGLLGNNAHQPIPDVFISDDNCQKISQTISGTSNEIDFNQVHNIMDVLGEYVYKNPMEEGKIILYSHCIKLFGNFIFHYMKEKNQSITKNDCIRLLYDIVVWHELGHWITHWMLDKSGSRWNSASIVNASRELKEGLAQLFTFYAIKITDHNKQNYSLLFEFIQLHQEDCYLKHTEILRHENFTWENVMISIQGIRKDTANEGVELKSFLRLFR